MTKSTMMTRIKVDTTEKMAVKLVIVDTWHPNGWVRTSHRSI